MIIYEGKTYQAVEKQNQGKHPCTGCAMAEEHYTKCLKFRDATGRSCIGKNPVIFVEEGK